MLHTHPVPSKENHIFDSLPDTESFNRGGPRRYNTRLETFVLTVSLFVFMLLGVFIIMQVVTDAANVDGQQSDVLSEKGFGFAHPFEKSWFYDDTT